MFQGRVSKTRTNMLNPFWVNLRFGELRHVFFLTPHVPGHAWPKSGGSKSRVKAPSAFPNFQDHRILNEKIIPSIDDITKAVTSAAKENGKSASKFGITKLTSDDPLVLEEKDLARRRRLLSHGQERKELSIKLCGVRRQIKATLNQMKGEKAVAEQRALHRTNNKISTHALHDYRDPQTIHDDPSDERKRILRGIVW